jgi:hypothetical protein
MIGLLIDIWCIWRAPYIHECPPIQEEGSFTYSLGVWRKLSVFEHWLLVGMKHVYKEKLSNKEGYLAYKWWIISKGCLQVLESFCKLLSIPSQADQISISKCLLPVLNPKPHIVEEKGGRKAMKGWNRCWTATQFGGSGSDFWNQSKN